MYKTYCVSDIHGRYDLFQKLKDMMDETDKCYVLGDCADRGSNGWDIIAEVRSDDRFIYLKGNHEDMLAKAIKKGVKSKDYHLLRQNGGQITYSDWFSKTNADTSWADYFDNLPEWTCYTNSSDVKIHLSHAGFTPGITYDFLWDRTHYLYDWDGTDIIVHGHTPIPFMREEVNGEDFTKEVYEPFWYSNDRKCCIDSLSAFTGKLLVLDLDWFSFTLLEA